MLGEGGQGIVLEVHDRLLERNVALKTLKRHTTPAHEEYLAHEAKISGVLEHPNIPPTYDLGADETGTPFFVMRKVEGISLEEILRHGHRSSNSPERREDSQSLDKPAEEGAKPQEYSRLRLLSIFEQVCHAIEYAHSRGVLHLDIKPGNVKLGPYGEVFLLDWGFAARKDEAPRVTGGTPIYIAPERLRRETPDERADIYSLGILLYRMLTGAHPYDVSRLSFNEYREQFDTLPCIPPRARDRTIAPELDAIVLKAIARQPEDRYPHVHQLAADLQRFLDGVPVTAYRAGIARRLWKLFRRHSTMSLLVGALILTLILTGAVVYLNRQKDRLEIERREANRERERAGRLRTLASIPFEKGRELMAKNPPNLEAAREFLSQAISQDPAFPDAFFERGRVNMRLGATNAALADFRQVLALYPSRIMAHYYAGTIQMDVLKDTAAAEAEFAAMQAIDRDNEYSNLGLARLHILAKRYAEALDLCDRIEERNPSLIDVYYLRGIIYGKKGEELYDPQKALAAYDRYLATPSETASSYANRGDLRQSTGDIEGALSDYAAALAINPDYVWALNNRGWIYYAVKNDPQRALEDFHRAARAKPDYYWTYMNRGAVYESLRDWTKAGENYRTALELEPGDYRVLQRMGECAFHQRKYRDAFTLLGRALDYAPPPAQGSLFYLRGLASYALGEDAAAVRDLERSLGAASNHFPAAILRHIALLQMGREHSPADLLILAQAAPEKPWFHAVASLWCGALPPERALESVQTPEARSRTLFYVGLYCHLVRHDRTAAVRSFERCIDEADTHLSNEYVLAREWLERLADREEPSAPGDDGG
ncbi:MAG: tetratricopeptide repeat protein [Planctomycetota bacterium]